MACLFILPIQLHGLNDRINIPTTNFKLFWHADRVHLKCLWRKKYFKL